MKNTYPVDYDIKALCEIFNKNGYCLYVVGGAVRDFLLSRPISDVDFTTDATPDEMLKMFPYSIKTGIKHGTLTIPFRKKHYEITTFRIDGKYTDSRHPEKVDFVKDLKEDLSRRDFTINAMAANALTGEIVDVFGGLEDLKNKVVRTVGDAKKRFLEDALRMMRAIRFSTTLNFNIDRQSFEAIIELSDNIKNISSERIQVELFKTFSSPFAHRGLLMLHKSRLLYVIDEDLEKNYANYSNAFAYTTMSNARLETRLASLFYSNSESARKFLRKLKCSNAIISYTTKLSNALKEEYAPSWNDKDIRRFVINLGCDAVNDFFTLLFAYADESEREKIEFYERVKKVIEDKSAIEFSQLEIKGDDVKKSGITDGKKIGDVLKKAHDFVLENPQCNKKDILLKFIQTL